MISIFDLDKKRFLGSSWDRRSKDKYYILYPIYYILYRISYILYPISYILYPISYTIYYTISYTFDLWSQEKIPSSYRSQQKILIRADALITHSSIFDLRLYFGLSTSVKKRHRLRSDDLQFKKLARLFTSFIWTFPIPSIYLH